MRDEGRGTRGGAQRGGAFVLLPFTHSLIHSFTPFPDHRSRQFARSPFTIYRLWSKTGYGQRPVPWESPYVAPFTLFRPSPPKSHVARKERSAFRDKNPVKHDYAMQSIDWRHLTMRRMLITRCML
jgi:hypothetical protein